MNNYDLHIRYSKLNYSCSTLSCTALAAPAHTFNIVPHTTTSLITFCFPCCLRQVLSNVLLLRNTIHHFFSASISFLADSHPVPKTMTCTFFKLLLQQHPTSGYPFLSTFLFKICNHKNLCGIQK